MQPTQDVVLAGEIWMWEVFPDTSRSVLLNVQWEHIASG